MNNLMTGLSTTLIGMLIVFFGLAILIACISVMHRLMTAGKKKEAPKEEAPEAAAAPEEPVREEEEEDDSELVAVIAAAIQAVWDNADSGFIVRRVRRVNNTPAGSRLARDEQMFSHM